MAESCANCGRADLLQAQVVSLQCLACGALTDIATKTVVAPQTPGPELSNAGTPVVELSHNVTFQDANEFVPPVQDPDAGVEAPVAPVETPVVVESAPAPVVTEVLAPGSPIPVDFTALTPEQIAQIEAIAHPGG